MRLHLRPASVGYELATIHTAEPGHRRALLLSFTDDESGDEVVVEICECAFRQFRDAVLRALEAFERAAADGSVR